MKTLILTLALAALSLTPASADEKTTTTTTTTTTYGTGTLHEYTPGSAFVVKETSGPVSYKYGEKVVYVTKSGTTLTEEQVKARIKVGIPVRVQYSGEGDTRTVTRVEIED